MKDLQLHQVSRLSWQDTRQVGRLLKQPLGIYQRSTVHIQSQDAPKHASTRMNMMIGTGHVLQVVCIPNMLAFSARTCHYCPGSFTQRTSRTPIIIVHLLLSLLRTGIYCYEPFSYIFHT